MPMTPEVVLATSQLRGLLELIRDKGTWLERLT